MGSQSAKRNAGAENIVSQHTDNMNRRVRVLKSAHASTCSSSSSEHLLKLKKIFAYYH